MVRLSCGWLLLGGPLLLLLGPNPSPGSRRCLCAPNEVNRQKTGFQRDAKDDGGVAVMWNGAARAQVISFSSGMAMMMMMASEAGCCGFGGRVIGVTRSLFVSCSRS